jgi:hypothetical protein
MEQQHRAWRRAGWRAGAMIMAAAMLAAGCGTVPAPTGATVALGRHRADDGPPAGSRARALALATHLLSRRVLPRSARRLDLSGRALPQALRQPSLYSAVTNSVDVHEVFAVPPSMAAAVSFLLAHRPAGMSLSGRGTGSDWSVVTSQDVSFSVRSVPGGTDQAELVATVVPGPHGGALVRVDVQVIWFPARSGAEYLRPAAYRAVTIAGSLMNPRPRSRTRTFTSPAVIARLARLVNGLHGAPYQLPSCPMIDSSYRLEFTAVHRGPAAVIKPSECLSDLVTVGGTAQPLLWDPGNKVAAAAGRLLGLKQRP